MKKIIALCLAVAAALTACSGQSGTSSAQALSSTSSTTQSSALSADHNMITPKDAKVRLDSGEKITLLDVRTQEEYAQQRIANSILIPYDEIEAKAASVLTDKDAVIFVYCHSGRRSAIAVDALIQMGYTHVYDLGGIQSWPYDTISG